jgi:hypothetical protein
MECKRLSALRIAFLFFALIIFQNISSRQHMLLALPTLHFTPHLGVENAFDWVEFATPPYYFPDPVKLSGAIPFLKSSILLKSKNFKRTKDNHKKTSARQGLRF